MTTNQALKKAHRLQKTYDKTNDLLYEKEELLNKINNSSRKNDDLYNELLDHVNEMIELGKEGELEEVGITIQFLATRHYNHPW